MVESEREGGEGKWPKKESSTLDAFFLFLSSFLGKGEIGQVGREKKPFGRRGRRRSFKTFCASFYTAQKYS